MKTEIMDKQAVGKTISRFAYSFVSGQMVISFSDETFITFGVSKDYDGEVNIVNKELALFNFGDSELIESGIISKEEIENKRTEYNKLCKNRQENSERLQYERLKAKFD